MNKFLISVVVLLLISSTVNAAIPGRLFFTLEQRATLDTARKQKVQVKIEAEETQVPQLITLNGMVKRSDGQGTVWVNNKAISDRQSATGLTVVGSGDRSGTVTVQVPQTTGLIKMKVGQSIDLTSGEVSESYGKPANNSRAIPNQETIVNPTIVNEQKRLSHGGVGPR